mgnify:CR=1 FL=1
MSRDIEPTVQVKSIQMSVSAQETVLNERLRELLDTGAKIFAEKGFENTSMKDISDACGVSKSLLYHHFGSKDNFYSMIASNSSQQLSAYIEERMPHGGSATEKVRAFMLAMAMFFEEHRWAWIVASSGFWNDPDVERRKARVQRRRALEQRLRELIEEGMRSGEFATVDPAMAGRLVLSSINWLQRWYQPGGPLCAVEIVGRYCDMILKGVVAR